jgi:Na+/phosphate symporter
MDEVTEIILRKKELRALNKKLVKNIIKENLNKKYEELIKNKRFKTKDFKKFVRIVRAQLRRQYGAFQLNIKRRELLERKDYVNLLKSHQSSKERLKYYEKFYKELFAITGKPDSIIDIGCGMNPISFEYMNLDNIEYILVSNSIKNFNSPINIFLFKIFIS